MKNFGLIGLAGYVAPRHLQAIKETGNNLLVAHDTNDSVGVVDSYFPNAKFFTELERFDRYLTKKWMDENEPLDYISICTPNYLHDAHIRLALRNNANAICEKPLVINPWNLELLNEVEQSTGRQVYTILQLRLHPTIKKLKNKIDTSTSNEKHDISLSYITSRGNWYEYSWKGNLEKSGGLSANIGIHFFDMLIWIFGAVQSVEVHESTNKTIAGYVELEKARVRWFLSIDSQELPNQAIEMGKTTFRSITIDGQELEFSEGFTDLHTESYKNILDGKGVGIAESYPSIELTHKIRNMKPSRVKEHLHSKLQ